MNSSNNTREMINRDEGEVSDVSHQQNALLEIPDKACRFLKGVCVETDLEDARFKQPVHHPAWFLPARARFHAHTPHFHYCYPSIIGGGSQQLPDY